MRNRFAAMQLAHVSEAGRQSSPNHERLKQIVKALTDVIDWLRAGYPDEAPRTGHSPLLALYGPLTLTPSEKRSVVKELGDQPTDTTTIEVVITKATGRLPTPTQTRMISRVLRHRTSPQ